jgi:hypothetical protein
MVGWAGRRHPLGRGTHDLFKVSPRVSALLARVRRHMRHPGAHALAGQSAGHMQAKAARVCLHIGHA